MTDDELIEHARAIFRRAMFSPPNPADVTEWAYKVCHANLISETQLYCWLLNNGECFSSAYRLVYGPPPHEVYADDWRGAVEYLRKRFGWSYEQLADYVRGWHDSQNASTVRRALDPEATAKQAEYQRTYCQRNPERRAQTQADYYQRNRETLKRKARERRQANRDNPTVPMPDG